MSPKSWRNVAPACKSGRKTRSGERNASGQTRSERLCCRQASPKARTWGFSEGKGAGRGARRLARETRGEAGTSQRQPRKQQEEVLAGLERVPHWTVGPKQHEAGGRAGVNHLQVCGGVWPLHSEWPPGAQGRPRQSPVTPRKGRSAARRQPGKRGDDGIKKQVLINTTGGQKGEKTHSVDGFTNSTWLLRWQI